MTWLEFFSSIASSLSWPIAVFCIAAVFSKELKAVIPRIRKVSATGVELGMLGQNDDTKIGSESQASIRAELQQQLLDPVAAELENKNREDLAEFSFDSAEEKEAILLRALTVQQMMKSFSIAYSNIFGSQILALKELNSRSISRAEASKMFKEIQTEKPALENLTLDQYLNFLFHWKFIEEQDAQFKITETGRNFLKFLVDQRLSEERLN